MNLFDLTGKVAVVTGGSRGIGKAICTRFAAHGANVVISSRKLDACEAVVGEIKASGGNAAAQVCNIADKEQLRALVDFANTTFGGVDILVCNAAVNPYFGPSADMPDEAFDRVIDCNVRSVSPFMQPGFAGHGANAARTEDLLVPRNATRIVRYMGSARSPFADSAPAAR